MKKELIFLFKISLCKAASDIYDLDSLWKIVCIENLMK